VSCRRFGWAFGIDWERKGGPLLLDTASILGRMGYDVEVVVLGPDPSRVPAHPSLRALGYVHKGRELQRFVEIVRSFHFGCLLSRVEASGFSTLEYLRLGIPIITTAVGGIVDAKGAGLRFPVEADGERVAEALAEVLRERALCDDEEDSGSRGRGLPLGSKRKRDAEPA
jgi:glycosyltransferase involved in cell wall biosynthesis